MFPPSRLSSVASRRRPLPLVALLAALAALVACEPDKVPTGTAPVDSPGDGGFSADRAATTAIGAPLRLLTPEQQDLFARGSAVFQRVFTPATGLGPLFNGRSCALCHANPVVGGGGDAVETHATAFRADGTCDGLTDINGGSVVQDSVTPALHDALGIDKEPVPWQATGTGRRATADVLGFGLLEAVPEREILALADPDDRNHDGISGRPNRTADGEVGRFGRKAQVPSLSDFVADAFIYEQGITSPDEAEEQTIGGSPLPPGVDPRPDPEVTEEDLDATAAFLRFLAPPPPIPFTAGARRGYHVFGKIGCAECHVPALFTGPNRVSALSHKVVRAYTDLLLHDMGPDLADICVARALPSEFRTEPLMGLRFVQRFLHDGRAGTIEEAISLHGGEAARARDRFLRLSPLERRALLQFLHRL